MPELGSDLGGAVALLGDDVVAAVHDRGVTQVLDIPKRARPATMSSTVVATPVQRL